MKQALQTIILFVKNLITMKRYFAFVQVNASGVQYSNSDEDCCGKDDGCCGNCNCE